MNSCERYEFLASLVIDEEATLEEQAELEKHLESCPDCRAYFEDIKRLHEVLTPEKIVLPEGFAVRVMDRVRETEQERPAEEEKKKIVPFPRWWRWAAMAACCAVAVLSVWAVRGVKSARDNVVTADDALHTGRSSAQEQKVQDDIVESEAAALSDEAPPPVPEEYEDLAKSAAKEGLGEGEYQPLIEDENEPEEGIGTSGTMSEWAMNGGDADMPKETQKETADTPEAMERDNNPEDGTAAVDRMDDPEVPMPAPAMETDETPGTVDPVEVINAPEQGILIAFGGAAQIWVENILGAEWASGGSYTLSVEQYSDLLRVLEEAGEPYSFAPGEGYCLMAG